MAGMGGSAAGGAIGGGIGSLFDDMNALDARNRAQQILSAEKDNFGSQRALDQQDVSQAFAPMMLPDGTMFSYDPNSGWSSKLAAPLEGALTGGESQVDPYTLRGIQGDISNAALSGLGEKYRDYENDASTTMLRNGGIGNSGSGAILGALAQRQGQDVRDTLAKSRADSYGTYNAAEQGFNQNRYAPLSSNLTAQSPLLNAMMQRSKGVTDAVTGGGAAANGAANALNGGLQGFNTAQNGSKDAYGDMGSTIGSMIGMAF